jgi:hypothetical protein
MKTLAALAALAPTLAQAHATHFAHGHGLELFAALWLFLAVSALVVKLAKVKQ